MKSFFPLYFRPLVSSLQRWVSFFEMERERERERYRERERDRERGKKKSKSVMGILPFFDTFRDRKRERKPRKTQKSGIVFAKARPPSAPGVGHITPDLPISSASQMLPLPTRPPLPPPRLADPPPTSAPPSPRPNSREQICPGSEQGTQPLAVG